MNKGGEAEQPLEEKGAVLEEDGDKTRSEVISDHPRTGALPDPHDIARMIQDREAFKASTIYFAYDRSSIQPAESTKVDLVAEYLKNNSSAKVLIEGHSDERGTEEYNRSLGERRALSLREYFVNSGIDGGRVFTQSWGEDKPVDEDHSEVAWSRNRRGEFVLLK
jgi:peptidoglycan-associated lipoprotein